MADINQLSWTPIDKNDNISELIDKINHNFSQFAMYNGGTPGADGADGTDGMVTKSRCIIHAIKSENTSGDSGYTEDECLYGVIEYYNGHKDSEDWLDGDIIIYGSCIFKFNPTANSYNSNEDASHKNNPFEQISFIKGEKGEKGDTPNSVGYFKLSEGDNSDTTLSFDDTYEVKHLILDNYSNTYTTSDSKVNAPIDWETDTDYSLIFSKNNTDGLIFFKITDENGNKKKIGDTIIKHTINQSTNQSTYGVTKSSQFDIWDKSTLGSYYTSENNMILRSNFDKSTDINDYRNKIEIGNGDNVDGINITSIDNINLDTNKNFTLKYSKLFEVKTGDKTILSIGKDSEDKDAIKISGIYNVFSSGSLLISHEGDGEKTETININDKVLLGGDEGNIALNGTIYNNNPEENQDNWSIDNNGDAIFHNIYGWYQTNYGKTDYSRQEISKVFSRLDGEFTQFIDYHNPKSETEIQKQKQALREQIGAISSDDLDNKLNEKLNSTDFRFYTYVPVGTVIMSAIYNVEWITDEFGALYRLCDGSTINTKDKVTAHYKDTTGSDKTKVVEVNLSSLTGGKTSYELPDLSGRFIVGVGNGTHTYNRTYKKANYTDSYNYQYSLKDKGGIERYELKQEELPRHRHEYAGNEEMKKHGNKPNYSNSTSIEMNSFCTGKSIKHAGSDNGDGYIYYTDYDRTYETVQREIENRPPYYALTYYIKIQNTSITPKETTNDSSNEGQ